MAPWRVGSRRRGCESPDGVMTLSSARYTTGVGEEPEYPTSEPLARSGTSKNRFTWRRSTGQLRRLTSDVFAAASQ